MTSSQAHDALQPSDRPVDAERHIHEPGATTSRQLCICHRNAPLPHQFTADVLPTFIHCLSEGLIYTITNFEVVQAYDMFKVTESEHSIRFTDCTEIKAVKPDGHLIKTEVFRTLTYAEYLGLANTNLTLPGEQTSALPSGTNSLHCLERNS
ncbi:unnamed protein product [Cochlearia groenlandica]